MLKKLLLVCFTAGFLNAMATDSTVVRVLTYNVHHCNPPGEEGVIDINGIAKVITEVHPDVVALQEIDVHTGRSGHTLDQARALGAKTGMHAFFLKNIDYDGGAYGVAILSKSNWIDTASLKLPMKAGSHGEPRGMAIITLKTKQGQKFHFGCTHLDLKPENRIVQIKAIKRYIQKLSDPVIIAGDLNAVEGSDVINALDQFMQRTCDHCPFTIPVDTPDRAIDFIAFSPGQFTVQKHQVIVSAKNSDHLPVYADLQLSK